MRSSYHVVRCSTLVRRICCASSAWSSTTPAHFRTDRGEVFSVSCPSELLCILGNLDSRHRTSNLVEFNEEAEGTVSGDSSRRTGPNGSP